MKHNHQQPHRHVYIYIYIYIYVHINKLMHLTRTKIANKYHLSNQAHHTARRMHIHLYTHTHTHISKSTHESQGKKPKQQNTARGARSTYIHTYINHKKTQYLSKKAHHGDRSARPANILCQNGEFALQRRIVAFTIQLDQNLAPRALFSDGCDHVTALAFDHLCLMCISICMYVCMSVCILFNGSHPVMALSFDYLLCVYI